MARIAVVSGTGESPAALAEVLLRASRRGSPHDGVSATGGSGKTLLTCWDAHHAEVASDDGLLAVFDGVIYNRAELPAAASDAQRLCLLYRAHGFANALRRINGDFAAVLFDSKSGELWLGRDRFGVRPLYYTVTGERFAAASRPRALLALPGVSSAPRREFVALFAGSHYRTFDNRVESSPFEAISQLPAAHVLRVVDGRPQSAAPYWSLVEEPDYDETEAVLAERYRSLLIDSVSMRMATAQRPVFTLSGGMDSSSVLACAVRSTGRKQQALSTVYDDATYDESPEIRTILQDTVDTWRPVKVGDPDLVASVQRMIEVNDEPVATATWLSHFVLCEQAARMGFQTVFGGLGGDELNAGEYEYFIYFFADLRAAGDTARLEHEIGKWVEYHDHPIFKKSAEVVQQGLERLVDLDRPGHCLPDVARLGRYRDALDPAFFDLAGYRPVMDEPFHSYLKNRTYQDIFRETAPCCLRAADRQTAAFGLEACWPFFDHRLVELMFRVRSTQKIRDGVTKHLLREAMRGVLPESTRGRIKKTGWNAPAHLWFSGRGREQLQDLIGSRRFRERGIYDLARVQQLLDEHLDIVGSGRVQDNHMMFFWQLLNLELWLQAYEGSGALG